MDFTQREVLSASTKYLELVFYTRKNAKSSLLSNPLRSLLFFAPLREN